MSDNPFVNETPRLKAPVTAWKDATVTSIDPLLIQLDGYMEEPQPPTKPPLVGGLAVNDRVCCRLENRQLIIHGRYGG